MLENVLRNMKVLISEEEIQDRIKELASDIKSKYNGESVHLVCVLKGAVMFYCDLAKALSDIDVTLDFISCSSYLDGTVSTGVVKIVKDLEHSIEGKNVIIVEDIIDTGYTLDYLIDLFKRRMPKDISICTLLDKPYHRKIDLKVDFTGFKIEDKFVIGYGLDYVQHCRALPFIGYIESEGENNE